MPGLGFLLVPTTFGNFLDFFEKFVLFAGAKKEGKQTVQTFFLLFVTCVYVHVRKLKPFDEKVGLNDQKEKRFHEN